MDSKVPLRIATISIWNMGALVITLIVFMMLYIKAKRTASLKAFFLVQISMMMWLVGKVFKTVSPNAELRWAFIVFYYAGICLLEVAFLEFGFIYNKGRTPRPKYRIALYAVPIIQFIIILTNPSHLLFYSRYSFSGDDFGILFYVHVIIEYVYIIAGMVYCSSKFRQQLRHKSRGYTNLISGAIIVPIILNFIYITRTLEAVFDMLNIAIIFDITPIIFTWSLLVFLYATFKFEFFDISPVMKHEIANKLDTPLCIVNRSKDIIFANKELEEVFDDNYIENLVKKDSIYQDGDDGIICYNDRYYKLTVKHVNLMGSTGYIINYNDITSYQLLSNSLYERNEELEESNKKLQAKIKMLKETSYIGARNYVARELHDVMGHSLVVTKKLLEVCKINYKKDGTRSLETLQKARHVAYNGIDEMKVIHTQRNEGFIYSSNYLERELSNMIELARNSRVEINFYFRGKANKIDGKIFDITKKICTELITNTFKHANASKILISVTVKEGFINIRLMDNGIGCDNLVKGNGLKGIDDRLELVGGRSMYTTCLDEGFNVNIMMPR